MTSQFRIKVGAFEGPLDLLLGLIEERKMLVSDVSLGEVADDFITHVRSQQSFPASDTAQFIVVAATLLLLKSRSLLPMFSMTNEEEGDAKDLAYRLTLYQAFREIARSLSGLGRTRLYFGGLKRDESILFSPAPDMSVESLLAAVRSAVAAAPERVTNPEVSVAKVISIEEMMQRLGERLERALTLTFRDFLGSVEDRREMVVGFLALLELMKRGLLLAEQDAGGEIKMNYAGSARAPRYD